MHAFRSLMALVLIAGAASGLILSAIQHVTIGPLIARAEAYEDAAAEHASAEHASPAHAGHGAAHGVAQGAEAASGDQAVEWEPADGAERIGYTVLGTVLTGIGFAAVLFGLVSLLSVKLTAMRGVWLGLMAFGCFTLAPAIGLPPKPPAAPAAELYAAQMWWAGTVLATTIGVSLIVLARGSWSRRLGGAALIVLPHLIGAPSPIGDSPIPQELATTFAIASVATQGVFWILLGAIGGWLFTRLDARPALTGARA
jgi:cobalt transporter subunit CbtA